MNHLQQAYVDGWNACMRGEDGRYTNPHEPPKTPTYHNKHAAWVMGFLDAMEAEDGDTPQPETVGF